jgi:hypothetical protein
MLRSRDPSQRSDGGSHIARRSRCRRTPTVVCSATNTAATYEHAFVTSQGHPYAPFRHALATGNLRIAEAAARDVQTSGLKDGLELCLLYRDDPERYERAAARWIARLIAERPKIQLSEIELAAAGFREAMHTQRGVDAL